jgi:hypothetical protein
VLQNEWFHVSGTFLTRVGTYVQRGSKFCFVVLVVLLLLGATLVRIHLSNFTMLSAFCTNARQPYLAAGSLAWPGSLASFFTAGRIASFFTAVGRHAALHTFTGQWPAV